MHERLGSPGLGALRRPLSRTHFFFILLLVLLPPSQLVFFFLQLRFTRQFFISFASPLRFFRILQVLFTRSLCSLANSRWPGPPHLDCNNILFLPSFFILSSWLIEDPLIAASFILSLYSLFGPTRIHSFISFFGAKKQHSFSLDE